MQELSKDEVDSVSGANSKLGAALTLGATIVGIGVGVAAGGVIGVIAIAGVAVGGLAYAYDYYKDNQKK
ncbi:MAG: hypothetical protein V4484_21050 [Pseudomonadota bacterium]